MDNFKDAPQSISELRADKNQSAAAWTARDVLISLLRRVDSGEMELGALIVCFQRQQPDGPASTMYTASSPDLVTSLGLLSRVEHMLVENTG